MKVIEKKLNFIFRVNIPDIYKSTYGEICRADATAIDLGKLNKYYYEFGRYVAAFDRNGFVGKIIYEVCRPLLCCSGSSRFVNLIYYCVRLVVHE